VEKIIGLRQNKAMNLCKNWIWIDWHNGLCFVLVLCGRL